MSDISPLTALNGPDHPIAPALAQAETMGRDQFLQLLVAQISQQDPLDPMDDREMVAQLAQFTQVEQAIETNRRLAALEQMGTDGDRTALSGLIGKHVSARGETVTFGGEAVPQPLSFNLHTGAEHVTARLLDADGQVIRSLESGAMAAGSAQLTWDGRDSRGRVAPAGTYRLGIQAVDADGRTVGADTQLGGTVTSVSFDSAGAAVMLGDVRVRPADIIRLSPTPAAPAAQE